MKPPVPILRGFNEEAWRDSYIGILGFEIAVEHRSWPGAALWMGLRRSKFVSTLWGRSARCRVAD